jgi:hypothetical protein
MPFAHGLINELQNVHVTVNITTSEILMKLRETATITTSFFPFH